MIRHRCLGLALSAALLSGFASEGQAAIVNFTLADFTNVNQVSTNGTLVEAVNLGAADDGDQIVNNGTTDPNPAVTMNGVTFAADPAGDTFDFFVADADPLGVDVRRPNYINGSVTGLADADGIELFNSYERSQNVGADTGRGVVDGLIIGQAYEIQLFLDRNSGSARHAVGYALNSGDPATLPSPVEGTTGNFSALDAVVLTGTFTADAATQDIFVGQLFGTPSDGIQVGEISAYQLRAVAPIPEPSSIVVIGLALVGLGLAKKF